MSPNLFILLFYFIIPSLGLTKFKSTVVYIKNSEEKLNFILLTLLGNDIDMSS
jgi:hypothetical protein